MAIFCILFAGAVCHAVGPSVTAAIDSSQITMGYRTAIKIETIESAASPSHLVLDKETFPGEVEVVDWVYGDTIDLGNGMIETQRALIVQPFDSGVYTIPPFMLVNGPDTLRSKALTLKVNPVDVSHMEDINPLAPPARFHSKWYDWLPDWLTEYWGWYLLALLIIAGGVCGYLIYTKKVTVNILPQKKRLPPDLVAFNRLNELKDAQLWERGQEKEYYTRLIDILREYLQERFGINAMEMTSSQILKALRSNEETRLPQKYMEKVVEIADYVKFAKVRPMPDDNVRSWQNAMQFVEETRPVTVEEDPEKGEDEVRASDDKFSAGKQ
ncbi:MAG: protein BatD [Bacteroidales bacterium]|nr:protein BatD [Bacteroidales bacterium]